MRTSTSPWSRSRWLSSATGDSKRVPSRTAWRSRSIERSGCVRALTARRGLTVIHSEAISDGSNENS